MTSPVREKMRTDEAEARSLLPDVIEIPLTRTKERPVGAMLYLRPQLNGRWMADVRWPDVAEKDPLLAAGGYRTGYAESSEAAAMLGHELFADGPVAS